MIVREAEVTIAVLVAVAITVAVLIFGAVMIDWEESVITTRKQESHENSLIMSSIQARRYLRSSKPFAAMSKPCSSSHQMTVGDR